MGPCATTSWITSGSPDTRAPTAPRTSGGCPGIHCPLCGAVWSDGSDAYPSADLSLLPDQEKYSARLEEDYGEFERLREQVRPLVPPGVPLWPGTKFGPLVGSARGEFGPLFMYFSDSLLLRGETLRRMQAAGVQGLKGYRTEVRFRKKDPPELLELELLPQGTSIRTACPSIANRRVRSVAAEGGDARTTSSSTPRHFLRTWTCSAWKTS